MNLLDLREKVQPQIKVIEKVVFKKVPWYLEALKITLGIAITTTVVWGVSNADVASLVMSISGNTVEIKSFSAVGIVESITPLSVTLNNVNDSDNSSNTTQTYNLNNIEKIQTKYFYPLRINDILVGDKIIVQGVEKEDAINITSIISFSKLIPEQDGVMSVIEPDLIIATSTSEVATTTTTSTEEIATSTPETSSSTISSNISTSTNETSSSTPDTNTATTTATSTDENATSTLTEIISNIIDATTSILTGSTTDSSETPPTQEVTPSSTQSEVPSETPPSDSNPAP